jgi:glycogen debranching enzyme
VSSDDPMIGPREIADGEASHAPRGAPFQAWSLAELLRMRHLVGDAA